MGHEELHDSQTSILLSDGDCMHELPLLEIAFRVRFSIRTKHSARPFEAGLYGALKIFLIQLPSRNDHCLILIVLTIRNEQTVTLRLQLSSQR